MSLPENNPITCPNCGAFLPSVRAELELLPECPACKRQTQITLFAAYDRPAAVGAAAQKVVMDGEATCFYHSDHRAHVPCDACGRFLCALCDLDLNGRHLCPPCLELAMTKKSVQSLERNRNRWDKVVLLLLVVPLFFCYVFLPFTALGALCLIGWKWKSPGSLVVNTRARLMVYGLLAAVQFAGGSIMWWMMFSHQGRR